MMLEQLEETDTILNASYTDPHVKYFWSPTGCLANNNDCSRNKVKLGVSVFFISG